MREVIVTARVDMRDISTQDLIRELENRNLMNWEVERLRRLIGFDFIPDGYKNPATLDEGMKLEVIVGNLDKKSYLEICSFFEGKLPFEK